MHEEECKCSICSGEMSPLDVMAHVIQNVDVNNWIHIIGVLESENSPPFSYTIGMWKNLKQPELCTYGLPFKTAQIMFNNVGHWAEEGKPVKPYERMEDLSKGYPMIFVPVTKQDTDAFAWTRRYYREKEFPKLQMVWPDRFGMFPWEKGFEEHFRKFQPEIGDWPKA